MKSTSAWVYVAIALSCLGLGGCTKKQSERIDAGRFEGSQYRNDYFGMALTLPETWSIQERQAKEELTHTGEDLLAGDDKSLQAAVKAAQTRTLTLFMAFQYPVGSPVLCNPNIMCVAERVSHAPGIKTGADYLFHARRFLGSAQMKYTFDDEVRSETLAAAEFHVLTMELAAPGTTVKQEMYATIRKGHALVLTITFSNDEEREALRDILETLSFSPLQGQSS